jgi:phosphoribosylformylglycinamidine synthase II
MELMTWRIEVQNKKSVPDAFGEGLKRDIEDLGISGVLWVETVLVYVIEGTITEDDARNIAASLLADPTTQDYSIGRSSQSQAFRSGAVVEVAYNPGVMDPVEQSALKGISDLGIDGVTSIRTAKRYFIGGEISPHQRDRMTEKLLMNPVIQHVVREGEEVSLPSADFSFQIVTVDMAEADDEELRRISLEGQLYLDVAEMKAIRDHFIALGRKPTDAELETLAQTWSEHCVHKTFRGVFDYEGRTIDNLLKETIMRVTKELDKPWCVSVFEDNAGVIEFDDHHNLCFKVETHNHPSAIEPYGGAGTGIGGVIRDPMGTGLGAKPVLNTDIFCFGPPDVPHEEVPRGVLHPKRVMKGVVAGVRDYGNRMGIPTANGAILFDDRYIGNPLVYCGTVGLLPKECSRKEVRTGDAILLVGGRTGRDGIHGVTFASAELTEESEVISSGAVQIGNPITEKKMLDTLLQARDRGLYKAITDCGGGGLSSAVGEMGSEVGAWVQLEKVPLKYKGLSYTEIWISEAQERMVISVPPEHIDEILEIFQSEDVEATVIGAFTDTKRLHLTYQGETVADLDMEFLHHGVPRPQRRATWTPPDHPEPDVEDPQDATPFLERILSSWNVCSKEWVIRQYDHEVQGGSVLKPLVGADNDGPGDACVFRPLLASDRGVIISNGINPKYGDIDPYHMAASAIDEALRGIVAVGGDIERVALLDNFCWGNTDDPEKLGALVRASQACYDIALGYGTPFISGKDSLNNEFSLGEKRISVPHTLLISAMGILEDVTKAVSMDAKQAGNLIYVVGVTKNELGGSQYYAVRGSVGNRVPQVDPVSGKRIMAALHRAISNGLVRSCHDCSEGGLGVAAAEMAFAGSLGMEIHLAHVPVEGRIDRNDTILFSESNSRFVVEVSAEHQHAFEDILAETPFALLGRLTDAPEFRVYGLQEDSIVRANIADLKEAWQKPLRW